MNERIKELRKALGITQAEFGTRIGLKRNTIATYEMGRNEPTQAVITSICREFDVNETWLRTGSGEMFRQDLNDELHQLATKYSLTAKEMVLIEQFVKLSKPYREAVLMYVQSIVDAWKEDQPETDTTEAAEAAYQEALGFVPGPGSSASNTSAGIQEPKEAE